MSEDKSIREIRLEKLEKMIELGSNPYVQEKYEVNYSAIEILDNFESIQEKEIHYAGRIVSLRVMGKAAFAHISDGSNKVQCYFKKDDIGENAWELVQLLDIGDHAGVSGKLFTTKTGEKSIYATTLKPLSKCLHNLPLGKEKDGEKWYGLTDTEQRYRHRHLDLICNKEVRDMLVNRMKIIAAVRRYFDGVGYLESETPVLQQIAGGAAARPFTAHYNAYDLDVKLRISLELYLKRLICGDIPKIYEIGRVFRNEGVSNRHNPEFTMLEFYEAYVNLEDMMLRVEELFKFVAEQVFGTTVIETQGITIDFSKPWKRINLLQELEARTGITPEELSDINSAKTAMKRVGLPTENEDNLGGIIEKLLERFVEPNLIEPTFIIGYPIETSPLAKKDPNNPKFTRRFEGYIGGREICNAFSELNDPIDQLERFNQQLEERSKGDDEAHPMDEEFIYAMECGMPPTGGCGIGLDRMAMVLTGASHLREVLLFPMMKPEKQPITTA